MNILITGGAGFIGSNFCHYYYNESDRFVVLDALTYAGDLEFIKDLIDKPNFRFVHGNITDARLVNELFSEEKFDVVINFADITSLCC
jgi:dTDP-glucose 4,6-dehydratase